MELEETPSPVDPEVRAYIYSLVSAVRQYTPGAEHLLTVTARGNGRGRGWPLRTRRRCVGVSQRSQEMAEALRREGEST